MKLPRLFVAVLCAAAPTQVWAAAKGVDAAGAEFFEKKIRPVLAEKCYQCHASTAEKIKGGLLLDTRDGLRHGGDSGPAVVPGQPGESLLIEAIRYGQKDSAMPPSKAGGKLPEEVIRDFEKWVQMGAPDPRDGGRATARLEANSEARKWWAWQLPQQAAVPPAKSAWARTDIDRHLLAGLSQNGLKPTEDADKPTLLRRIYFDLVGLPPTPEALHTFTHDASPEAFAKVVDELLASPQFGERWGRHWLDVARFAESSGKQVNIAFPHAWRYRDYVVAAFNEDKPFDHFIREQIAGDLLPAKDERTRAAHIVATGFLALGPKSMNEPNARQFALDLADEQIDAVSQAFLGVTVACARCHDHKFDPISQRDYYALAGIFLSTETRYGTVGGIQNRRPAGLCELPVSAAPSLLPTSLTGTARYNLESRLADLRIQQKQFYTERYAALARSGVVLEPGAPLPGIGSKQLLDNLLAQTEIELLDEKFRSFDPAGKPRALAMGVRDLPVTAPPRAEENSRTVGEAIRARQRREYARPLELSTLADSFLYARGDADKPGEKVPRGFIEILSKGKPPAIPAGTSGRLQLAEWIVSPGNPLTARVIVNRVWHWLFGEGIVASPDNFGTTGRLPSNQALLDHLALEFRANGWSVKKLVREIVLSHAYQLASTYDERSFAADPDNALHWRMNKRRLDAECIRDAVLTASGELQTAPPIGDALALNGDGAVGSARLIGTPEEAIVEAGVRTNVRSLYLPIARDILPDALAVFDFPDASVVTGSRETTNVPAQALFMLNSPFITRSAELIAARLAAARSSVNIEPQVSLAYQLIFGRTPTVAELRAAEEFFARVPDRPVFFRGMTRPVTGDGPPEAPPPAAPSAAWTSYCRALLANAEFRYLD